MSTEDKDPVKKENISESQRQKQNQDFENLPAASQKQSPPDIDKKDIAKSSKINEEGKTDNTEKQD